MKSMILLLFVFTFISCSSYENKKNDIKVGMTYDEVENLLGKPISIDRGFTIIDTTIYRIKIKVEKYGELLYVNWLYKDSHKDTLNTLFIKVRNDTMPLPKITSRAEYDAYRNSLIDTSDVDYIINKTFSILFDASSGRVVKWGYFPVNVE